MANALDRLFTYARAASARPLENFTTEALAIAILADPKPFFAALRGVPGIEVTGDRVGDVKTQVHVGGGIVDLELTLEAGKILWIEIKAHAGEHGNQIERYIEAAKTHPGRPLVMMLSKRPLRADVPTLRWNHLRDEMAKAEHIRWKDLKQFVERQRMADDFDNPITLQEFAATREARNLPGKVARLAREFFEACPATKVLDFPNPGPDMQRVLGQQYQWHGRWVVVSKSYPHVIFGLIPDKDDPERAARLSLSVEFKPADSSGRDTVFAIANENGLSDTWQRSLAGWSNLQATMPIEGSLDREAALTWLCARFDELQAATVLEAIARPR